ncbi:MAG: DNRLRE domain-containing protein [Methylotenera sp.]|uniref:Kelch repeat-containing protein n=1 Tax=Methylotenera sp. TaxID=2051956 RepID=UPI0027158A05|nr:DNRLRE domain-containing protein [Methylotenera sp.]MDO9393106.1 DNRLRE domain-containing protein [Methylotenera sp.]MDP1523936.1 DNRLRE domain-containing protein [Methylotenera sp.]MDZ4213062.1 DNRLRE domain-containing protein [Methylotenera sp.]
MKQQTMKMAGFTLLPVVLAMSLIAAIAFLLNRDNGMNISMAANQMDADRARYAAEAGLQAVNAKIQSFGCAGGYPVISTPVANNNFSGAAYSAYATTASGNTTGLISTGTYNGTTVTLTRNNIYVYQSAAKTYTLQPNAASGIDTYITRGSSSNRGTSNTLSTDTSNNYPLVKFNLSMFPMGSMPVSATLSLYASGGLGIGSVRLYRITNDWDEGSGGTNPANWTLRSGISAWSTAGGDYHPGMVASAGAVTGSWINFEATDIATAWLSGRYANQGVLLGMASGLGSLNFTSSDDSDTTKRPKITFNYLLPCGTTGPFDPPPISMVTLTPTADSFNDSSALLQNNNGAATTLKVFNGTTLETRILTQFNTSSIPAGSTIQSAKLRMYVSGVAGATVNTKSIWANAINESWVEGTGINTAKALCPLLPSAGTSWNYRTNCTNWSFIHPPYTAQLWTTMTKMPTARTGLAVVAVNNKIYAIGGLSGSGYVNKVEEYDPATNTWATKAAMPTARGYAAAAVVNGNIYVMGGTSDGTNILKVNEVYDPVTNTWANKATMPTGRILLAAAVVNNKIYAIGGTKTSTTTAVNTNEEYDPANNKWTGKANMPTARMWFSAESVNGKIHAIGGWSGSASKSNNEAYDPTSNSWATKATLPSATDSMASAVMGNKIYLISGYRGLSLTNAALAYDTVNNVYTTQANYPVATNEPAAAAIGGKIYSMGGDNGGSTYYQSHYQYDPGIPVPIATASEESGGASPLTAGFMSGWINFDLKPLVQEWVDGVRPNNGLVIYSEIADQLSINSRENTNNKPQLIVTY